MFQTIEETLDYIYSFTNLEKSGTSGGCYTLDNIRKLLDCLGNPQNGLKYIHIAGTKGKGSTSLFITRLLLECGYNTLTFTSPHLVKTNERITYNMMEISDKELIELTNTIKNILEEKGAIPTTFEFFFLVAVLYGIQKEADYFVIETGLGGRLDCTNVITPEISVITTIGYDHMELLGNTIQKIATEKAGIIKPERPVILGHQVHNCRYVFQRYAISQNAPFYSVEKLYLIRKIRYTNEGLLFSFQRKGKQTIDFALPFFGKHQIWNFLTALEAVMQIFPNLIEHLKTFGTIDLQIPGRIEQLSHSPLLFIDTAHNRESIDSLLQALHCHFPKRKWNILFSVCTSKDFHYICKKISLIADQIFVTNLSAYKKSDTNQLALELKKHHCNVEILSTQEEAFRAFMQNSKSCTSAFLVTGSFYLAGPFREWYSKEMQNIKNSK